MWRTPEYNFEIEKLNRRGGISIVKHLINVTKSAPNKLPGKQIRSVIKLITRDLIPSNTEILDLGAGKLGKSLFLIKQGFQVYSTEYDQLFQRGLAKKNREEAEKYPNFRRLLFPEDFYSFDKKMDLILMINVQTVMPIPIERIALLIIAKEKLKENGMLLWYSDPLKRNKKNTYSRYISDGHLTGDRKKRIETFYVELLEKEIEAMLNLSGYVIDRHLSNECNNLAGNNIVYVSRPQSEILLRNSINIPNLIDNGTYDRNNLYTRSKYPSILDLIREELESVDNIDFRNKLETILATFD
ncbi:MAG: hypothetical protein ACTSVV_06085 [Promethearchaeota archaeon]